MPRVPMKKTEKMNKNIIEKATKVQIIENRTASTVYIPTQLTVMTEGVKTLKT